MTPVRVLGIGSPFGDDQAIEALEKEKILEQFPKNFVFMTSCDRPGIRLLELMKGAEFVILIDAVQSGAAPGTLHRLSAEEISTGGYLVSSHDFGVASSLALACALGEVSKEIVLFGIEIPPVQVMVHPDEATLSKDVRQTVSKLVSVVICELNDYRKNF